ncbi:MAG TPA: CDP-alcohol phosphatidyltransferase family protein [Candidatus Nanopelagicales bacterium]|jgi:CDP-diacylglycerol--glycerol-3-phosphate 3-phosphatidyltransferase|nr:CDP-alcohol phosphatidyltransferase family protein [Candidatus Nanopelagicales bacterium]
MLSNTGARAVMAHVIEPVARALLRLRVSPDAVTLVGTVGVSAAALWFYPRAQWLAGTLVILLFVFSDMLDGTMARLSGRQGPWGAFLDSTLDRVADGAVFGGMLLGFLHLGDSWTAAAALACLVGAFTVSYAKARAESLGTTCDVGIAERSERLIAALGAALLYGLGVPYLLPAVLWVLAVLTWVTVGQRIWHVRGQLHKGRPVP